MIIILRAICALSTYVQITIFGVLNTILQNQSIILTIKTITRKISVLNLKNGTVQSIVKRKNREYALPLIGFGVQPTISTFDRFAAHDMSVAHIRNVAKGTIILNSFYTH